MGQPLDLRIASTGELEQRTAHLLTKGNALLGGSGHRRTLYDIVEEEGDIGVVAGMEVAIHRRHMIAGEIDIDGCPAILATDGGLFDDTRTHHIIGLGRRKLGEGGTNEQRNRIADALASVLKDARHDGTIIDGSPTQA